MNGNTKAQSSRAGNLGPATNNVLVRPNAHRIPWLIGGIEAIEVVTMIGECHEVFGPSLFVKRHQLFWIPIFGMPEVVDILETKLGWMTIVFQVVFINGAVGLIHIMCIPVTLLRDALGRPVRPDAELGVAEPFWALVLLERFPISFEGAFRNPV